MSGKLYEQNEFDSVLWAYENVLLISFAHTCKIDLVVVSISKYRLNYVTVKLRTHFKKYKEIKKAHTHHRKDVKWCSILFEIESNQKLGWNCWISRILMNSNSISNISLQMSTLINIVPNAGYQIPNTETMLSALVIL